MFYFLFTCRFCLDRSDQGPESEEEIWADDVGTEDEVADQDDNLEEMPKGSPSSSKFII